MAGSIENRTNHLKRPRPLKGEFSEMEVETEIPGDNVLGIEETKAKPRDVKSCDLILVVSSVTLDPTMTVPEGDNK